MTGILTHLCFPSFWRIFPTLSAWLSPFYELSLMAPGVTGASICGCQVNEWGRADIRGKSDIDDWPQYFGESRRLWRQADWRTCTKEGHSLSPSANCCHHGTWAPHCQIFWLFQRSQESAFYGKSPNFMYLEFLYFRILSALTKNKR